MMIWTVIYDDMHADQVLQMHTFFYKQLIFYTLTQTLFSYLD